MKIMANDRGTWRPGVVMEIEESQSQVLIHYNGWDYLWDEWVSSTSRLIQSRKGWIPTVLLPPKPTSPLVHHPELGDKKWKAIQSGHQKWLGMIKDWSSQIVKATNFPDVLIDLLYHYHALSYIYYYESNRV